MNGLTARLPSHGAVRVVRPRRIPWSSARSFAVSRSPLNRVPLFTPRYRSNLDLHRKNFVIGTPRTRH